MARLSCAQSVLTTSRSRGRTPKNPVKNKRRKVRSRSETITIDKSGANTAAVLGMIADSGAPIKLRQSKYLNNLVKQDHRAVKRIVRPMLGFKSFRCAARTIAGIETMHMIRKGQMDRPEGKAMSAADQFYSLAFDRTMTASRFRAFRPLSRQSLLVPRTAQVR